MDFKIKKKTTILKYENIIEKKKCLLLSEPNSLKLLKLLNEKNN